jgi:hypothetical protein
MKKIILGIIIILITGCSNPFGSKETKKFDLPSEGGYSGRPVGSCSQDAADAECKKLGWDGATDWECRTVHVSGGFWGSWDQAVMYSVTCYRD